MLVNLNAHEILMSKLPEWFKPVIEYIAIMEAYGYILDKYSVDAQEISKNFFIQTADVETIEWWEKTLGLTVLPDYTMDYRRSRIIQRFAQKAPFTVWDLKDRLDAMFGEDYTMSIDPVACTATFTISAGRMGALNLLFDLLHDVLPTHLQTIISQSVKTEVNKNLYAGALTKRLSIQTIGG